MFWKIICKSFIIATEAITKKNISKFNKSSQKIQILEFGTTICQVAFKNYFERMFNILVAYLFPSNLPILHGSYYGMSL